MPTAEDYIQLFLDSNQSLIETGVANPAVFPFSQACIVNMLVENKHGNAALPRFLMYSAVIEEASGLQLYVSSIAPLSNQTPIALPLGGELIEPLRVRVLSLVSTAPHGDEDERFSKLDEIIRLLQ